MNRNVVIGGVIVAVAVLAAVVLSQSDEEEPASSPAPTAKATARATASATTQQKSVEVKYTESGFEPKEIRVKAGQSVLFNNDIRIQVSSDPHPQHTINSELNGEVTLQGKGELLTLNRKGSFGIHDHLNPSNRATVIVE